MFSFYQSFSNYNNVPGFLFWMFPFMGLMIIWSLLWKGWALWESARAGEKWWFIALLVINTMGILEILYLFVFTKRGQTALKTKQPALPLPTEDQNKNNS